MKDLRTVGPSIEPARKRSRLDLLVRPAHAGKAPRRVRRRLHALTSTVQLEGSMERQLPQSSDTDQHGCTEAG